MIEARLWKHDTAARMSRWFVVRLQGPRANGMSELHKLAPSLGPVEDKGHRVALMRATSDTAQRRVSAMLAAMEGET